MTFYQRRLPHWHEVGQPVFLTWRLAGSLPPGRSFSNADLDSGQAFVAYDRLLDNARTGPLYLGQPEVAQMVVEAIHYNSDVLKQYSMHAYTVMANHVHLLATPMIAVPKMMKSLKTITARRANEMLGLTGKSFWQQETYDRLVRNQKEFERIWSYIEHNPVRAGLVTEAAAFSWSARRGATGGRARVWGPTPPELD